MKKILAILLSLLSCGFLSACSAEKTQPDTPDTETVWEMVSEAYIYAFPLVLTDATKTLSTNTDGTMTGRAPINQFNHAKKLADASFRTVVTPNVDTVYSQAWLDISTEPMVYVLPETDRFCNVQLLDAWTNTAAVLDKAGAYAIALPGWEGELPDGVTRVDGDGKAGAVFLKRFLADSIVRDFEHLRRTEFGGARWVTLGQSYGGFLTLTYLSLFPQGVIASFTTGGIPHVPADATDVYRHTFPRMVAKTKQFYERYPIDIERAAAVADILQSRKVALPNGDPLTVERFQCLGSDFGMKPSFERVHWILDQAFLDGDGSASTSAELSDEFLSSVMNATSSRPLYWPLQEFIYANGELETPICWAAQRVRGEHPEFAGDIRPLNFTGEAMFPWMFEQERALRPFKPAMDVLMKDTHFGTIYDADQLARNEVPLQAAVYFDDMYVDSGLQLDTLSRIGRSHYWTTNEFEHDGVHGATVFRHLFNEALNRGDLAELF